MILLRYYRLRKYCGKNSQTAHKRNSLWTFLLIEMEKVENYNKNQKKKKHKKSAVNACAVAQGRNEAENEAYLEATFTTRLSHWYSSMRICIF